MFSEITILLIKFPVRGSECGICAMTHFCECSVHPVTGKIGAKVARIVIFVGFCVFLDSWAGAESVAALGAGSQR